MAFTTASHRIQILQPLEHILSIVQKRCATEKRTCAVTQTSVLPIQPGVVNELACIVGGSVIRPIPCLLIINFNAIGDRLEVDGNIISGYNMKSMYQALICNKY